MPQWTFFYTFALHMDSKPQFQRNTIVVDADYLEEVASNLSTFLSGKIHRAIPSADLAEWLVCCAIDASVEGGENTFQVIFVHSAALASLAHFTPCDFSADLDGKAFRDPLMGEFLVSAVCDEHVNMGLPLFVQSVEILLSEPQVEKLILVANIKRFGDSLSPELEKSAKNITLLTMTPDEALPIHQEILGYSLLHAMGIEPDELN